MKHSSFPLSLLLTGFCIVGFGAAPTAQAAVNVTQYHNHASRDGLFIEPAFTPTLAASVTRDTAFTGTIVGNVYSQPLYIEGGPGGVAMVIATTESNNVYALNANTGAIIWQRSLGTASGSMGNISPVGITGTPVVDLASRSLFINAVVSGPNNLIFSLNVDTGAINAGWPVDVNASVSGFSSSIQSQRAALTVLGSKVYVPYGGYFGDAGSYRGRVVGVEMSNPATVTGYATAATKAGIWGPGGIAHDGTNLFVTTGNATSGSGFGQQESIVRLQSGPVFSGSTTDYWAPTNWASLDSGDTDLGGSGPILVDVPGATPSALVVALGKDGNAYVLNRTTLGGVSAPIASSHVGTGSIIQAAATYRTAQSTYVVFRPNSTTLTAFKITAANPPAIATGWTISTSGRTSPFVTQTSDGNNTIVWAYGVGSNQRLFGFNGDTGATIYAGGGATDVMSGTRSFNTGIAARGKIYIAADNKVYKFNVPSNPPTPTGAVSRKTHGAAGDFDINLPLSGTPGIECRSGGATDDYTMVVTFGAPMSVTGDIQAEVTTANALVGTGGVSNGGVISTSGNSVIIPLTNVANAQTIGVKLSGVTDGIGYGDVAISMSRLLGDANGNGTVSSSDIAQVKAQTGLPIDPTTVRADVVPNGAINATDVAAVKSAVGTTLP